MALDQTELSQIISAVLAALKTTDAAPKAKQHFIAKGGKADANSLADKDAAIVRAFTKRGFKDVQLMDRSDKAKPFNIKPFKLWLEEGRVVRRGQRGFHGLFHRDQTDALPVKAAPKGKPSLKAVKAAPTLPLA